MFVSKPKKAAGRVFEGAFGNNNGMWPGQADFKIEFANGTTQVTKTMAKIKDSKFNYTDAESLFKDQCLPSKSSSTSSSTLGGDKKEKPPLKEYPEPVVREPHNLISGYFPDDEGMRDVAVLAVPSFQTDRNSSRPFADTATDFVNKAVSSKKKKMVIDLSGNGGGNLGSGLDLFKLFFPQEDVYLATRFRDHEAVRLMIKGASGVDKDNMLASQLKQLAPQFIVKPDQKTGFKSWEELYGPHEQLGVQLSSLHSNLNFSSYSEQSMPIRGYGEVAANETQPPFASEDILIVS